MNKLSTLALVLLGVTGCAATGTMAPDSNDGARASRVQVLDTASPERSAAEPSFPARIAGDTELRAADRFAHRVTSELGGTAVAAVTLCVAPDGSVADASLAEGSGLSVYDALVLDAARGWRYDAFTAPSETRVCDTVSVVYRAH